MHINPAAGYKNVNIIICQRIFWVLDKTNKNTNTTTIKDAKFPKNIFKSNDDVIYIYLNVFVCILLNKKELYPNFHFDKGRHQLSKQCVYLFVSHLSQQLQMITIRSISLWKITKIFKNNLISWRNFHKTVLHCWIKILLFLLSRNFTNSIMENFLLKFSSI